MHYSTKLPMELQAAWQPTNWTFKWRVRGCSSQIFRTDYSTKHQVMDLECNEFLASMWGSDWREYDLFFRGKKLSLCISLQTCSLFSGTVCFMKCLGALDALLFSAEVLHSEETCFLRCVTASKPEQKRPIVWLRCTCTKWRKFYVWKLPR